MLVAHQIFLKGCVYFLALLLLWARLACATDNYVYRAGEYAVVSGGRSPDGCWSIAAHGGGDYGYDGFDLYLMREPKHEKLASLHLGEHLDTAPLSNIALWAPDSNHVAILYRTDRHILDVRLFSVAARKAQSVAVPSLVNTVGQGYFQRSVRRELFGRYYRITWRTDSRLMLEEFVTFDAAKPVFRTGLEAYVKVDRWNTQRIFSRFSASAVGEITSGKLRLSGIKPLPDQERTIVYSPHLLFDPQLGLHATETTLSSLTAQKGLP